MSDDIPDEVGDARKVSPEDTRLLIENECMGILHAFDDFEEESVEVDKIVSNVDDSRANVIRKINKIEEMGLCSYENGRLELTYDAIFFELY